MDEKVRKCFPSLINLFLLLYPQLFINEFAKCSSKNSNSGLHLKLLYVLSTLCPEPEPLVACYFFSLSCISTAKIQVWALILPFVVFICWLLPDSHSSSYNSYEKTNFCLISSSRVKSNEFEANGHLIPRSTCLLKQWAWEAMAMAIRGNCKDFLRLLKGRTQDL